ncbi:hypothetical protein [Kordiimonas aquimaris]|uniref:hypothetical protein n=1 Tax=Kordiimonas aquimaris TaxID=707591 RepID=UPI0021D219A1|nr:hypothetical protein [Kordiimonas aquimaris]
MGALPVACFTFLTLQWSIVSGKLAKFTDAKDLQAQYKKIKDEAKEAKTKAKEQKKLNEAEEESGPKEKEPFFRQQKGGDLLHGKLMFFGGGFYGTMALFTYLIVEVDEVLSFLGKIIDFTNWHFSFSFQFVIDLFINSIMNIVAAFVWFHTLQDYADMGNGWIWLVAAYAGYLGGVRFTREKGDEAWQFLSEEIGKIKGKLTVKR